MKRLSFLLALLLAFPALAQYAPSPRDPQAPVELPHYKGNYADFKVMHFICKSDERSDYITSGVCTVAKNEAHSGAMDVGLRFDEDITREDDDGFILMVRMTSSGRVPRAVSVQVEASRYYNEAVDKAEDPDSPAGFPRRGKLVFFEDTITGVGAGDSLENGIRAGMRHVMHKLFSEIARDREGMH